MALEIITEMAGYLESNFKLTQVLYSALVLAVAYGVAKLFSYVAKNTLKSLVSRTKTTLDDKILVAVPTPMEAGIVLAGLYLAIYRLSYFAPYIGTITKFFSIAAIGIGALFLSRVSNALMEWYVGELERKQRASAREIKPIISKILRIFIILIVLLVLFGQLGIEVTPLVASLGIAGLAIALAFQDTLSNFFSGLYLVAERPYKIGDFIKLESGEEGYVEEVGWRTTKIRMLRNVIVIIPNTKLAQSTSYNYSAPQEETAFLIPVSVSYDSDLEKVEKVVAEVGSKIMKTVEGGISDFVPFIRYNKFGDSGINFNVIMRAKTYVDNYLLTHEFIKSLHKEFKKAGIEIPYPKHDIYIKGGKL